MNFAHRTNLFTIFFKPLINFQEINIYWKKKKGKLIHFSTVPSAQPAKRPGPLLCARAARTQAATWA